MFVAVRTCRKNLRSEKSEKDDKPDKPPLKRLRCKTPPQRQKQRHDHNDDDDVNRGCGGRIDVDRHSSMPEKGAAHGGG